MMIEELKRIINEKRRMNIIIFNAALIFLIITSSYFGNLLITCIIILFINQIIDIKKFLSDKVVKSLQALLTPFIGTISFFVVRVLHHFHMINIELMDNIEKIILGISIGSIVIIYNEYKKIEENKTENEFIFWISLTMITLSLTMPQNLLMLNISEIIIEYATEPIAWVFIWIAIPSCLKWIDNKFNHRLPKYWLNNSMSLIIIIPILIIFYYAIDHYVRSNHNLSIAYICSAIYLITYLWISIENKKRD